LKTVEHNKANEANRKSVSLLYHKISTNRHVKRRVDPLGIKGHLLIGYDHKRKALRSFDMGRLKEMEKSAFWSGFERRSEEVKEASPLYHAAELGGLGILAAPSAAHLSGHKMKEDTQHKLELGGLGVLAAPSAYAAGKSILSKLKKLKK